MSSKNHVEESTIREEGIPDIGTSGREGPILFRGRVRTWYQIVTMRGRTKRSPTRTGQRQDKKLS